MSYEAVTMQSQMAAARCGAAWDVWRAVHVLHQTREKVVCCTSGVSYVGHITQISDDGFRLDSVVFVPWEDAEVVTAVRPTLGLERFPVETSREERNA